MSEHKCDPALTDVKAALEANGGARLASKIDFAETLRCPDCGTGFTVYSFKSGRTFGRGEYARLAEASAIR